MDLDGTLLDFKGAEYAAVQAFYAHCVAAGSYGLAQECGADAFYTEWCRVGLRHYSRYLAGELSFREQQAERVRELVGTVRDEETAAGLFEIYLRSFEASWRAYDDVVPCLEQLVRQFPLGIITNGDLAQQRSKLERIGISPYFRTVTASGEVGVSKPHAGIFLAACDQAGVVPQQCVYVGDDLAADVAPCTDLGIQGIWINRHGEPLPPDRVTMITSLAELPGILK